MRLMRLAVVVAAVVAGVVGTSVAAGPAPHPPTSYPGGTWQPPPPSFGVVAMKDVPVRMDDGVNLVVDVYYPADAKTGKRAPGRFPVLLTQTPYTRSIGLTSAASSEGPGDFFVERGYIFVSADVRGTGRSSGNGGFFSPRDAKDGVDLVHWSARVLSGSDGDVGLTGCSYLGQTQLYTAAMLGPGSPVKAMVPACVNGDPYRDTYLENGIPSPAWDGAGLAAGTLLGPTIEGYMVPQYLDSQSNDAHGQAGDNAYDRTFWHDRDHLGHATAIVRTGIPALLWDGWIEPGFGALELYAALQNAAFGRPPTSPLQPGQPTTGRYQLIVGDWTHGGGLDEGIMLEWFDTWIRHVNTGLPVDTRTPIHMQELGTDRWVNTASYPMTTRATRYSFGASGRDPLTWAQPSAPGSTVTYTTPKLVHGATLAGPASVTVYASSSNGELELMADLFDVAPNGSATPITRGGILGSLHAIDPHRTWYDDAGLPVRPFLSLQRDEYVPAARTVRYDIPLQPKLWAVRPGHALRLRLSTQADERDCMTAMEHVVWAVIGCKPRPAILAKLAGGTYTIVRAPSFFSVPLLPFGSFASTRSGPTPTSGGVALPLDW